jgi:glycosyltransferase involved in cell wall biosynthesis
LVNKSVTIASVGQLIPRKRFDLLLRALARIPDPAWKLKIIGNGIQRRTSENMANDLGIRNRTIFMGILENQRVRQELAKTDIFVLCSRWDGWGAVVNEALMSGVPVICSDYCGAADLIRPSFNGEIFRSNSLESLLEVLNRWISKGPLNEKLRDNIISWSRCIQGNAVANYFIEILDYLRRNHGRRPRTPWEISNMIQ